MTLTRLTDLDGQLVLVRLDQLACAYPSDLFSAQGDGQFDVDTTPCTKICMIGGQELFVQETTEELFKLSQQPSEL